MSKPAIPPGQDPDFIPPGHGGTPPGQVPCFTPGTRVAVPMETVAAVAARMRARANLTAAEAARLRAYEAKLRAASR